VSKEVEQILLYLDKYIDARKGSDKEKGVIYVTKLQFYALEKEHQKSGRKEFKPRYKGYEIKSIP
tara:strand:- start:164 stop:358 length:195 start_codon:yes stop_codon:yes gene_type:complete